MYAIGRNQHQTDNSWPNVVAFAFKKDNVAKLDGVKPGMRVKVGFAVDGREWTDPKTGKVRYFSSLSDSVRIDVCLEEDAWRRLVRKIGRASCRERV